MPKQLSSAFFLLMFCVSISVHASDTLKVKKVRFFIEPKASFIIPLQKHVTNSFNLFFQDPGPYAIEKDNLNNKTSANLGLSIGLSVRLCKHFSYEFSIAYNRYNVKNTIEQTQTGLTSNFVEKKTYNSSFSYNNLVIGNGIAFKNKRLTFTNSILCGVMSHISLITLLQNYNATTDASPFILMSEHKIGYSFLKGRIEPYIGINVLYNSSLANNFYHPNNDSYHFTQNFIMPFASVKINF